MHLHVRKAIRWGTMTLVGAVALAIAIPAMSTRDPYANLPPHGSKSGKWVRIPQEGVTSPRQQQGAEVEPTWGVSSNTISQIPAGAFTGYDSATTWDTAAGAGDRYRTGGSFWFDAPVNLRTGVKVIGFEVMGCDTNSTSGIDIWAWFVEGPGNGTSGTNFYGARLTNGAPGCDWFYYDLSAANITINNFSNRYFVRVRLDATNSSTLFMGVNIYYKLQMSPPPATPTFNDVSPSNPILFQAVEALVAAGITGGCGGGNYCPNNPVTRGQMAIFLATALGLHWPN